MTYRTFMSGVAATAMLLACGSLAQAADVSVPEELGYDWSGLYLGVHGGGIASNIEGVFENDDSTSVIDVGALSTMGFMGGAQVGWNWQAGDIVFGIEGDISAVGLGESRCETEQILDCDGTTEVSFDSDFLATVRGRVGWAADNVLLYATGGVAFLEGEIQTGHPDSTNPDRNKGISATGGIVGLGLEWGATENVSVKVEGLYAFFDDKTSLEDMPSGGTDGDFFEVEDVLIARIGVNFRFDMFGG